MIEIFLIVLPVFLILGAGYGSVRSGYLPVAIADALNALTVRLTIPILLFRAMYRLDVSQAFHPLLLVSFYVGAIASFVGGVVLSRLIWHRRPGESIAVGFAAMFSNTAILGLAIAERAFGVEALAPVFGIIAFHAPVLYTVGMTAMEWSRRDGKSFGATLAVTARSVLGNALMIGILAGIAFNLLGITIPEPVMAAVDMMAAAAVPAALIGIGAALTRYQLKAELAESLMVSALALILHPAIALVLSHWVFGLPAEYVSVAVIMASMPPGMNIYIFAVMYDRAVALSASALLIATTLSVATISFWLWVVHALLPA